MKTLPKKLNDGQHDYVRVRKKKNLGNGLSEAALYERVPADPDYQYTPDLAFELGQTKIPVMHKLAR